MFGRALAAFLVLPGMAAGLMPTLIFLFDPWRNAGYPVGYLFMGLGLLLLLWCVRDFYVSGKGTLAPWDPPKNLVVVGLYRYVRNPMYVSVLVVLVGWCAMSGSAVLVVYTFLVAILFHLRVTRNEEAWLLRKFSEDWSVYSEAVNRWLPRLTPWYSNGAGT